ncbi:MAG: hypothetical protein ACEQSB_00175 [Undibacterium sp.]
MPTKNSKPIGLPWFLWRWINGSKLLSENEVNIHLRNGGHFCKKCGGNDELIDGPEACGTLTIGCGRCSYSWLS